MSVTKCALYLVNSVPLPGLGSWVLVGLGPGVGAGPEGLARLLSIFRAQSPRRMRRQDPCGKRDQLWNLMKDGGRKIGASHHTARAHHGHGPPLRASLPHAPDSIWGSGNDTERKRKRKKKTNEKRKESENPLSSPHRGGGSETPDRTKTKGHGKVDILVESRLAYFFFAQQRVSTNYGVSISR